MTDTADQPPRPPNDKTREFECPTCGCIVNGFHEEGGLWCKALRSKRARNDIRRGFMRNRPWKR